MKLGAVLLASSVALVALSCSSTTTVSCAQRVGSFITTFTQRSGNCGDIAAQSSTETSQATAPPAGCTGTVSVSGDNCTSTVDETCPLTNGPGGGSTLHLKGTVSWDAQSTHGTGQSAEIDVIGAAGRVLCSGTYDLSIAKE